MRTKHNISAQDKADIIACIIAFILIPVIGPFIYLFIAERFAASERKLRLLSALDKEIQKSTELSKKLENTLTTIKTLKNRIASYENRTTETTD